jgi:hypothetical protein
MQISKECNIMSKNTDTKYRPYLSLEELEIISTALQSMEPIDKFDFDVVNNALRQIGKTILNAKANAVPAYTASIRAGTTKHSISKLELTEKEIEQEQEKLMQLLTTPNQ